MSLRIVTLLLSVAFMVVGCRREDLSAGFHCAGSSEFTAEETTAVKVAKAHLEKVDGKCIDAR
jgi:hypothetical protein